MFLKKDLIKAIAVVLFVSLKKLEKGILCVYNAMLFGDINLR